MEAVHLRELYDCDPRPTFVVDREARPAVVCHVNVALLGIPHVAASLTAHDAFRDWWDPESRAPIRQQNEFRHGRLRWTKFTVQQRWLVVSVVERQLAHEPQDNLSDSSQLSQLSSSVKPGSDTIFTVNIQSAEMRQHIDYVREIDWAATSLGPITSWSYEMNFLITTLMLETRPTALFLGPDHIIIYNLPYAHVSGSRHPRILGKSIIDAWPEVADPVSATVARSQTTGFADAPEEEYHFMVERYGYSEETFFMWSLVPLIGSVSGMYSIVTEITKQRLSERRVNALLRVGQLTSGAGDTESFWRSLFEALKPCEYDFPTAILYSSSELDNASSAASSWRNAIRSCTLEWAIGYPEDDTSLPKTVDMEKDEGLAHALCNSMKNKVPTLFREDDGMLPEEIFKNVHSRAFGDPCKSHIIIPIRISDDTVSGFLIVGLNTRRPYDAEYKDWIEVFSNLLGASVASVVLHEEEIRSRQRAMEQATKDREELNAEVDLLTQEANDVSERLQNFHDVANTVGLGYFEYDMHGKLVHGNNAFFKQSGHTSEAAKMSEFSFVERTYPDDVELTMSKWHTLAEGNPVKFEMRWKKEPEQLAGSEEETRDYVWILSACVPIKSEDGTVIRISGCNTDVSAQKEATRTALLRVEAERRLASFTELAPVGVFRLNPQLEIQYCNDKWFEITGHEYVPINKAQWPSVVLPEDIEGIHQDVEIILGQRKPHAFSFRLKKLWTGPDGVSSPTWILATATVEVDENGEPKSIIGTLTDVSQLKWAEAMQKVRVQEALESKRQQENFIDMTSHEMRNPLSAMVQCADSISSALGDMASILSSDTFNIQDAIREELKDLMNTSSEAIDTIQACATHQKRIVDDILTLSKLDSKLLIISPITTQPEALLQDAYKMFKDEAHKAGVHLKVQSDESVERMKVDWAILDPSRVLQVLINLLTNAIKFTKTQDVRRVEVTMGASAESENLPGIRYVPRETPKKEFLSQSEWGDGEVIYIHFTVRDTGCGLSPEHKAKLFMRFSQATPKTHVQYGGSGLGLFISRELTEMQGGSIGVQSSQDIGSTFSFYVKSRRAAPPSAGTGIELPHRTKAQIIKNTGSPRAPSFSSTKSSPSPSRSTFHILVVEDNLINQRVLCTQLKKLGCTVQVAGHGNDALAELSKTTYWKTPTISAPFNLSVVLMDVEMPVMDGLTCTRKIRELQEKGNIVGHVPIIAVSANARREQVEEARRAGMDDAISKPFRIPELMVLIQSLLGRLGKDVV